MRIRHPFTSLRPRSGMKSPLPVCGLPHSFKEHVKDLTRLGVVTPMDEESEICSIVGK